MKHRLILSCALTIMTLALAGPLHAAKTEPVGEAFGKSVTEEEFAYCYKTAALFTRSGEKVRTEDETRQEAWQDFIFLQEANRLGITVAKDEVAAEVKRLVSEQGFESGSIDYTMWVRSTLHEDVAVFERRIEDLLRINTLTRMKLDPEVTVTDEEMRQKFLNQYNAFESEYIRFDSRQEAEAFVAQLKERPALWKDTFDRRRTEEGQQGAAWINIMSLEALIDLWRIPTDEAYRIHSHHEGDFVVAKQYYGEAVFRLLLKQEASLKDYTEEKQASYRKMLTSAKKRHAAQAYLDDLIHRAAYRDYVQEKRETEKREQLKAKSLVALETDRGPIELRLFPDVAPLACENFIGLIERGFYNGLTFHRVKKDFMIQGGDPTGTGTGGESIFKKPFADETKDGMVFDRPGLLAMANSGPNTNTSQFFITTVPTPWLNGQHTIFGEVVSGLEVIKQIELVPTDSADQPLKPEKIVNAYVKGAPVATPEAR